MLTTNLNIIIIFLFYLYINPKIANFREHGLENAIEMEVMFSKTFATGEHSWDPYTSEVIEEGGQGEAEENRKGPTDEEIQEY